MPNSKIPHVNLSDTVNTHRLRFNQLIDSVGDVTTLTTAAGSIVDAINELDSDIGANPHSTLTTTAKTLTGAINELDSDVGDINTRVGTTALTTVSSAVTDAVNELKTRVDLLDSDLAVTIDSAFSQIGNLSILNTTSKTNLVSAINEVYGLIDSDLDFRSKISVTDAGGDGSLTYSSATGVFTYTGPSASEVRSKLNGVTILDYDSSTGNITTNAAGVRALFSGSTGVSYNSGTGAFTVNPGVGIKAGSGGVSIDSAEIPNFKTPIRQQFSAGSGVDYSSTTGVIAHTDTSSQSSVSNSSTTVIQSVTLDTFGHITALASKTIALTDFGIPGTVTGTEIGYVDGVTSSIQTQLNNKQPLDAGLTSIAGLTTAANKMIYTTASDTYAVADLTAAGRALLDDASAAAQLITLGLTATAAELNTLDGITASTAELNILDGVTASTAELNILDGVTATTAELNYVDGVTSNIQTQLNTKAPSASPTLTSPTLASVITITGGSSNWTVSAVDSNLTISFGGVAKMRLTSSGDLTVVGDITAYGTIS